MRKLPGNNGFTLVEVMLSMVIMAIGLFAIMSLIVVVTKGNLLSKRVTIATTLAQDEMERIKNLDDDDVVTATDTASDANTTYYRSVIVSPDVDRGIKTIAVDVYWGIDEWAETTTATHKVELINIIISP